MEQTSEIQQSSARSLAFTRGAAVLITVGIGVASFVLSFAALADLAARSGIPERLAWLWPLIVDGTILQATMAVVALSGRPNQARSRRYFWIVLTSSAGVSIGANALHAITPGAASLNPWLAAAIAVVAPVSLLASTHGLSLLIRVSAPAVRTPTRSDDVQPDEPVPYVLREPESPVSEAVEDPSPHPVPVEADALQPWQPLAEVLASRESAWSYDSDDVASVLHLNYERRMSHQAIGRSLGIDHGTVREIVSASSELLKSGDVSVERVAV